MHNSNQEARKFFQELAPETRNFLRKLVELFGCKKAILSPILQANKHQPFQKKEWEPKDKALIDKFLLLYKEKRLPAPSFKLDTATTVTGRKYYESLLCDIEKGPAGARACSGALQYDLKKLFEIIDKI